jgi:Zn-finger nucleic acid-binding protein
MPDAHGLHCPNCGAAAEPGAHRCPYCKARLATVSCPACFALLFDGAAFCPSCGAARSRLESSMEGMPCPGCRSELRRVEVGGTALLECTGCDGAWVDAERFEALCADGEAQAAVLHRYAGRGQVAAAPVTYRRCVRCGKMMNRVNFARLSGTIVDVCRGHGTFLDAGELHQIVAFLRGGGMERTREHQLEELRQETQRLQALEARVRAREGLTVRKPAWDRESFLHLVTSLDGDVTRGD